MTQAQDRRFRDEALAGRVALVTGAAQGIGEAIARQLSMQGAIVALVDRDDDRGRAVAQEIAPDEDRAFFVHCDLRDEREIADAIEQTQARGGRLDILINNAGINAYFDAMSMTQDDWESVLAVDLKASWLCAKYALPHLLEQRGNIVNIGSIHGRMTTTGMFPYAVAKSGIEGLTRSLALDYGPRGVRVNAVAPGWTRTELVGEWLARTDDPDSSERSILQTIPLHRMAEPGDVAAVVAFLAGDASRAITGAVIPVDCGLSARFA